MILAVSNPIGAAVGQIASPYIGDVKKSVGWLADANLLAETYFLPPDPDPGDRLDYRFADDIFDWRQAPYSS
jgi:hypothetical protein